MIRNESELFDRIKQNMFKDLEKSPRSSDKYDCYSQSRGLIIELKCRSVHYDSLMIEKKKYKFLMEHYTFFGDKPVYINATPYGVWFFKLAKIPEPQWVYRDMPETTQFGKRKKIKKWVGFIDLSSGVEVTERIVPEWDGNSPLVR